MKMVTLAGPGITYYADWYKPRCLDFAAKTIALHMKKSDPPNGGWDPMLLVGKLMLILDS